MGLVKFNTDVTPYMKGDVVKLDKAELKRIDKIVEERGVDNAYSTYTPTKEEQEAAKAAQATE